MKQLLGKKKTELCKKIGDKNYFHCWTSGSYPHYVAECWYSTKDADYVNYRLHKFWPTIRDGQRILFFSHLGH